MEDIAGKEGWTVEETIQIIWDKYAMENVKSHEKDLTNKLIHGLSAVDKIALIKEKEL